MNSQDAVMRTSPFALRTLDFRLTLALACLSMLIGQLLLGSPVSGQQAAPPEAKPQYETLPIADAYRAPSLEGIDAKAQRDLYLETNKQRRKIEADRRETERRISDTLRGRQSSASANEIDQFFNGYVIPAMTQTDDETLEDLGRTRADFFRNYLNSTPPSALRNQVIDNLTFPKMRQIVEGNFHPAVRINAMFIIGRLNAVEGRRGDNGQLPRPYEPALNYMLQAWSNAELPNYLKVPILAGLERHASMRGLKTDNVMATGPRRQLADEMINVLALQPNQEMPAELVYWMQRRAVRILGNLGDPGEAGRYAQQLRDLISNENLDFQIRVDAVDAYAKLDFSADVALAAIQEVIPKIADVVIRSAQYNAQYIDEKISEIRMTAMFLDGEDVSKGGVRESTASPGLGRGASAEAPGSSQGSAQQKDEVIEILPAYHRELVRRRFKDVAWAGRIVLVGDDLRNPNKGLKALVDDQSDEAKFIEEIRTIIDNMMAATDVNEPGEDDLGDDEASSDEDEERPSLADRLKKALKDGSEGLQAAVEKRASAATATQPTSESSGTEDTAGSSGQ